MPPLLKLSRPAPPDVLTLARRWLGRPPARLRTRAALAIAGTVASIGWIDFNAGFWVSLQFFYLLPIVLATAWFGWRAGLLTAALSVTARFGGDVITGIFAHVEPIAVFWNRFGELATYVIVIAVLHALFLLQHELEERVRQRTASLEQAIAARNQLQRELFETSRRERSAIGHDLHDGLGQQLTATAMAANLLATRLAAAGHAGAEEARTIVRLLQDGIDKTRLLARGLLLSAIEPANLAPELEELAETIRRDHGLPCEFTLRGRVRDIDVSVSSQFFYIAQEAARNAARHAQASHLEIDLSIDDRAMTLTVTDDGRGLPATIEDGPGMGLHILLHRSELIGAELTLESLSARGTRVACSLPLPSPVSLPP